jgi:hypothetical protein
MKKWLKRNVSIEGIPKLTRRHACEDRVLLHLGFHADNTILSSQAYRFKLKKDTLASEMTPPSPESATTSNLANVSDTATVTPIQPPQKDDSGTSIEEIEDAVQSEASSDENIVLRINLETNESPLQKSARLKRYRAEEIQYLGLEIIKPTISPPPKPPPPRTPPSSPLNVYSGVGNRNGNGNGGPSPRSVKLSKERFEDWLDTLNPCASPAIPASQPSTIAESEENLTDSEIVAGTAVETERRTDTTIKKFIGAMGVEDGDSETLRDGNGGVMAVRLQELGDLVGRCKECGRKVLEDVVSRELGVQTDLTGGLISF